jgi:hypothetical protein
VRYVNGVQIVANRRRYRVLHDVKISAGPLGLIAAK